MEKYTFGNEVADLVLAFHLTSSLRQEGYQTRLVRETVSGKHVNVLHTLEATRKERPNRKARGCSL